MEKEEYQKLEKQINRQDTTKDYLLRNIPMEIWDAAKERASLDKTSFKKLILKSIIYYLLKTKPETEREYSEYGKEFLEKEED